MAYLKTYAEVTWCPGCGNFGILSAFRRAVRELEEGGLDRKSIVITSGIGCHGKISDYLNLSSFYSIHGRSMATAQGIKIANPSLKVVAFAGDGDAYGEGMAHMIFAAKRNADISVIVHNNGAYSLTTGQFSPTSPKGFKGPSTPQGSVEDPINPLALMLHAGATFVARGYPGKMDHLKDLMVRAVVHEGFSIIDVLQPSVVFNDTFEEYNRRTDIVDEVSDEFDKAMKLITESGDRIPLGIFFRKDKTPFHRELYGQWNPLEDRMSQKERLASIKKLLSEKSRPNE
jgi:2-oxoglutarate ferredoxin oxidoreductase subunit beta